MIRRPPRSTRVRSSAASDVYKRQSMHNIILQMALRATGLEPVIQDQKAALTKKQTNLFVMAPPDMPTALSTGAIDGYIVAEPFNAAGELLAGARIIRFTLSL